MQHIRYRQRICGDKEKINRFLGESPVGIIGMCAGEYPYAVPVNFIWYGGNVYFHGMGSGKKEEILSVGVPVCFTVYQEFGTVMDPVPCHADTSYMSVMIFGKSEKLSDADQSAEILQRLVTKYMPDFYKQNLTGSLIEKYRSSMDGHAVSVYRIMAEEITAKENIVDSEKIFKQK